MFDWLVNTSPTTGKNYKDLLTTDEIFFTSSSNGERSFNFIKYARKKILNLILGVNFCVFRCPHPELLTTFLFIIFDKSLFFIPDNFLHKNLCDGAVLIGLYIWQMPTKIPKQNSYINGLFQHSSCRDKQRIKQSY